MVRDPRLRPGRWAVAERSGPPIRGPERCGPPSRLGRQRFCRPGVRMGISALNPSRSPRTVPGDLDPGLRSMPILPAGWPLGPHREGRQPAVEQRESGPEEGCPTAPRRRSSDRASPCSPISLWTSPWRRAAPPATPSRHALVDRGVMRPTGCMRDVSVYRHPASLQYHSAAHCETRKHQKAGHLANDPHPNPSPTAVGEGLVMPPPWAAAHPSPCAQGPSALWVALGMRGVRRSRDRLLVASLKPACGAIGFNGRATILWRRTARVPGARNVPPRRNHIVRAHGRGGLHPLLEGG